ncbi:hypothetical protein L484_004187 [Morus notabilis]|uniref:Jacalin-type lectin domain-containing protein n=1 Tax=Morus notabilis TaxID=981085 RepID=W9R5I2_9ROSA|nr:hypothetical protein L484_004187 [Morus notabilis]
MLLLRTVMIDFPTLSEAGILVGPFGGRGGNPWDDNFENTGVRSINLTFMEAVGSFRAVYDLDGIPVQGPSHPSSDIRYHPGYAHLNFRAGERITQVTVYIGIVPGATTTTPVVWKKANISQPKSHLMPIFLDFLEEPATIT